MLGTFDATAMLAVKDMDEAKRFYGDTLGLTLEHDMQDVAIYRTGNTTVTVYRSEYAGTNKATAATWSVSDLPTLVRDLRGRGVSFERYEMPGLDPEGNYYSGEGMQVAWFKDPAGNILGLYSRS